MAKLINRVFIYLYTWHYERNNNNPNIDPIGIASWVLGLWVGLWLVSIDCACSFVWKYDFKSWFFIIGIGSLSLISAGLFHNYYLDNNRAIKLYVQYKSSLSAKSPINGILIAIFFLMIPLVLLVIFVFIFKVFGK